LGLLFFLSHFPEENPALIPNVKNKTSYLFKVRYFDNFVHLERYLEYPDIKFSLPCKAVRKHPEHFHQFDSTEKIDAA